MAEGRGYVYFYTLAIKGSMFRNFLSSRISYQETRVSAQTGNVRGRSVLGQYPSRYRSGTTPPVCDKRL